MQNLAVFVVSRQQFMKYPGSGLKRQHDSNDTVASHLPSRTNDVPLSVFRRENRAINPILILGQGVCQLSSKPMQLKAAAQLADIADYLSW
jgi:hypothetical protein